MDELVRSIVTFLEFLLLGGVGVLLLPANRRVYVGDLLRRLIDELVFAHQANGTAEEGPNVSQMFQTRVAIQGVLVLLLVFYLGVVINAATYWTMQPAHIAAIRVAAEHMDPKATSTVPSLPPRRVFFSPFIWWLSAFTSPEDFSTWREDGQLQLRWQVESAASYKAATDLTLKQIRLARGAALMMLASALLGCWQMIRRRNGGWLRLCLSVLLYGILVISWWSMEIVYHRIIWAYDA